MSKKKFVNAEIVEVATRAQENGMTYGQYVAWQQTQREREEREKRKNEQKES